MLTRDLFAVDNIFVLISLAVIYFNFERKDQDSIAIYKNNRPSTAINQFWRHGFGNLIHIDHSLWWLAVAIRQNIVF